MAINLKEIFACPKCKNPLKVTKSEGKCPKCNFEYRKYEGIWEFLYIKNIKTESSQKDYESMHQEVFDVPQDGSYEILASIARGNKAVDIACGDGFIEELSPETVAVEFSKNALKNAKRKGAKYPVLADAQNLPFRNNVFDIAICAGSIEQFEEPQKAIGEMARISKIQVLTVHREFDFPFSSKMRDFSAKVMGVKNQPIEKPLKWNTLAAMLKKAKLNIIFRGYWTFPVNFGRVFSFLPTLKNIPSCFFVITIKK